MADYIRSFVLLRYKGLFILSLFVLTAVIMCVPRLQERTVGRRTIAFYREPTSGAARLQGAEVPFNPYGEDTIVYLHIQKTGGTGFIEYLVTALIPVERINNYPAQALLPDPQTDERNRIIGIPLCKTSETGWKRDGDRMFYKEECPKDWKNPTKATWLLSEKTVGWVCGVHAFYIDFKRCLHGDSKLSFLSNHNRFHYIVVLRHPLLRYVSEYLHALQGACWERSYVCNGKAMKQNMEIKSAKCSDHFICDTPRDQQNFTLEMFANCQESWSTNRMTVMLADHEDATCWNKTQYTRKERDSILLNSAKKTLKSMSYFGITEFISESGLLFEKTFGMIFGKPIKGRTLESRAGEFFKSLEINEHLRKLIIANNQLDFELYGFALEIFKERMKSIGKKLNSDTLQYIDKLNIIFHNTDVDT